MNCRICKSNTKTQEEGVFSFVCGGCMQKKCLESYPYEEFKPKVYVLKKKAKKRRR